MQFKSVSINIDLVQTSNMFWLAVTVSHWSAFSLSVQTNYFSLVASLKREHLLRKQVFKCMTFLWRWENQRRTVHYNKSNGKILKRVHRNKEELSLHDTRHGRSVLHLSPCTRAVCYRERVVGQLISSQGKSSLQISPSLSHTRY